MSNPDIFLDIAASNLLTVEETNYFVKNLESFLKGKTPYESIIKNYTFMKDVEVDEIKNEFPRVRTFLISRKKLKVYTPITISRNLIKDIYPVFCDFAKSSIILDPVPDSNIVAGLKFSYEGKIYDLTIENLNSKN